MNIITAKVFNDTFADHDLDLSGFAHSLREDIDNAFDERLGNLYEKLNIKDGAIMPYQSVRYEAILDRFVDDLTALAVELSVQNKPKYPRNSSFDDVLSVLHKMYEGLDSCTISNAKAEEFYDTDFSVSFGDTSVLFMNSAMRFDAVEECLLRILGKIVDEDGMEYDYSDDYVVVVDGEVKLKSKEG